MVSLTLDENNIHNAATDNAIDLAPTVRALARAVITLEAKLAQYEAAVPISDTGVAYINPSAEKAKEIKRGKTKAK